jgi:hypothetical protein
MSNSRPLKVCITGTVDVNGNTFTPTGISVNDKVIDSFTDVNQLSTNTDFINQVNKNPGKISTNSKENIQLSNVIKNRNLKIAEKYQNMGDFLNADTELPQINE